MTAIKRIIRARTIEASRSCLLGLPCINTRNRCRCRCRERVCVQVSTLRFTAAPLTVAYGRQRDARVAYVHNTVHRYIQRKKAVLVVDVRGCAYVCRLPSTLRRGRCNDPRRGSKLRGRSDDRAEPVLQHIVYTASDAVDVKIVASAGRRRHSTPFE